MTTGNVTVVLMGITLIAGVWIGTLFSDKNLHHIVMGKSKNRRSTTNPKAFLLCITVKYKDQEQKQIFKSLFSATANYCAANEYDTLSYEIADSDKNPLQSFIIERYKTKNAFTDVHRKGAIFLDMKEKMEKLNLTAANGFILDGHSYYETNVGFV